MPHRIPTSHAIVLVSVNITPINQVLDLQRRAHTAAQAASTERGIRAQALQVLADATPTSHMTTVFRNPLAHGADDAEAAETFERGCVPQPCRSALSTLLDLQAML